MNTLIDPSRFPSTWAHELPQLRAAHEAVRERERADPNPIPAEAPKPSVPLLLMRLGAEAPAVARVAAVLLDDPRPLDAPQLRALLRLLSDLSHSENALLHALRDAGRIDAHLWSTLVVPAQDAATRDHQRRAGALRSGVVRAGLALAPVAAGLGAGFWLAGPVGGATAIGLQLLVGFIAMPSAARRAEHAQLERTESLGIDLTPPASEVELVLDRLIGQPLPGPAELRSELDLMRLLASTHATMGPSSTEPPADRLVVRRLHELLERAARGELDHAELTRAWSELRAEATSPKAIRARLLAIQREATGRAPRPPSPKESAAAAERFVEASVGPWLARAQGTGIRLEARVESTQRRADGTTIIHGVLAKGWLGRERGTFTVTVGPSGAIEVARTALRFNALGARELAAMALEGEHLRRGRRGAPTRIVDTRDVGRNGFEVVIERGDRVGALSVTRDGLLDPQGVRWFAR